MLPPRQESIPDTAPLRRRRHRTIPSIHIPESVIQRVMERKKNMEQTPRIDSAPTPEERARGQRMMDHRFIIEYIGKVLRSPQWSEDDRVPLTEERPAPSTDASKDVPTPRATFTSNKRRRIAGPERKVSLSARLHAPTHRRRFAVRTLPGLSRV